MMSSLSEQKMLRVKDEEMSRSGSRGQGLSRREAGPYSDEEDEEDEEEVFSESELELYEQYKAAGYRDLVSAGLAPDQSAVGTTASCCVNASLVSGVAQRG